MAYFFKVVAIVYIILYFTACSPARNYEPPCAVDLSETLFLSNHEEFSCLNTQGYKPRYKVIAIMGGDSYLETPEEFRERLSGLVAYSKARADYVIYFSELEGFGTSEQATIAVEVMIENEVEIYDTFSVGLAKVKPVNTYIIQVLQTYLAESN